MSADPRILPPLSSIQLDHSSIQNATLSIPLDSPNIDDLTAKQSGRGKNANSLANLRSWKPGQSGNPNGRPLKPLTDKLTDRLIRKKFKQAAGIADAIIAKALTGDVAAFTAIADRVEGKPVQRVEGEQAITITIERVGGD